MRPAASWGQKARRRGCYSAAAPGCCLCFVRSPDRKVSGDPQGHCLQARWRREAKPQTALGPLEFEGKTKELPWRSWYHRADDIHGIHGRQQVSPGKPGSLCSFKKHSHMLADFRRDVHQRCTGASLKRLEFYTNLNWEGIAIPKSLAR